MLPVANRNWQLEPDKLGGTLKFNANLLNIVREVRARRPAASRLGTEWDRTFRDGIGSEYNFIASVRGDGYSVNNLSNVSNPDLPSGYFPVNGQPPLEPVSSNFLAGRAFPQVGLTWDYPLVHRGDDHDLPDPADRRRPLSAPPAATATRIPNEDSLGYRVPRLRSVPARPLAGLRPARYRAARRLRDEARRLRQGWRQLPAADRAKLPRRAEPVPAARQRRRAAAVGCGRPVRAVAEFVSRPDLSLPARQEHAQQPLDRRSGSPSARAVSASAATSCSSRREQVSQTITIPGTGQTILYGKREQLSVGATAKLTRYWSLAGTETINLTNSTDIVNGIATPQSSSTSLYGDAFRDLSGRCMAFIASLTQSGIRNGDVKPGYSVMFSVVFKNLGEIGGNVALGQPGRLSAGIATRRQAAAAGCRVAPSLEAARLVRRWSCCGACVRCFGRLRRCGDRCRSPAPARQVAADAAGRRPAAPTAERPETRIAAVVNDEVISVFDLISRMRMVLLSSNLPDIAGNAASASARRCCAARRREAAAAGGQKAERRRHRRARSTPR